jgi:hypothetical protein
MGFLTPALLAGAALVAVPVILHLVMRRQPRQVEFPALQFVRQRQEANRRRMNFRHWLLLALRCALVAGLAIALARPTLKGSGLRGKEGAPLAVALVLDNSLRMQYVHQNQTRQQAATEMAQWLVNNLPADAQVAVLDLSRMSSGFVVDADTADSRLRTLPPESNPRPLEDAVREAVQLVAEREDYRQEVFLFSDLSAVAWNEAALKAINQSLTEAPEVRLYLVDVGVEEIRNMALDPLVLRHSTLRPGEPLHIRAPITATGFTETPLVELYLLDNSGQAVKRGQRLAEIGVDGTGEAVFELGDLPLGTHQGYVQLAAADPLEVDNTRYFTVEVRPPAEVLLLGERPSDALFLREALQPSLSQETEPARFHCEFERYADAVTLDFTKYEAVCLLDPPALSEPLWRSLVEYADHGGGVGIFLGHRARPSGFNEGAAQQLLPGALKFRSRLETYLRPRHLDHPALAGLRDYAEEIPWQVFPVWQYWQFADLTGDTYTIARFANNQPALLERSVGQGRVLTLATAVSDPLEPKGREPWNLLPTGPEPWPFLALSNQLVGYLAQADGDGHAYLAGETVNLRLSPRQRVASYALYLPDGQSVRRTVPPGDDSIRISTTGELGNYRVASGGQTRRLDRGFSINAAPAVTNLQRVAPEALTAALPAEQMEIARTLDDVRRYVDVGRSGRELFSWAIALVALVWGSEHLLANRFYREAP